MLPAEEIKLAVNSLSEGDEAKQEFTVILEKIFSKYPDQATKLLEIAQIEITKTNLPKQVRTQIHNLAEHTKILSIENSLEDKNLSKNSSGSELLNETLKSTEKAANDLTSGLMVGNYRLDEFLGIGGMGEVWKATHLIHDDAESTGSDRKVAIKFLNFDFKKHPDAYKVFAREFSRTLNLINDNIIHVFEINKSDERVFIAMEFLSGTPLKYWIQEHPHGISLEEAKPIIKGLCNGLIFAHQNDVIHLDINPSNIFFDPDSGKLKIIDFGIARHANPIERDKTRYDVGKLNAVTEAYASLEMLHSIDPDPRDDIYSLACVTYELLTGHHPYQKNRADIVISEQKKPVEIQGLNSLQNKTLINALNPLRNERVPSVEQFRNGLLPNLEKPSTRTHVSLLVLLTISVIWLIPTLIEKFSDFEFEPVRQKIIGGNREAAEELFNSPKDSQFKILNNNDVINGLLNIFTKNTEDDAIQEFQALDISLQKKLYEDTDLKHKLIIHYKRSIDELINRDKYPIAEKLLSSINMVYPYDQRITETKQLFQIGKNQRINQLTKQFNSCVSDHTEHLLKTAECFVSTRNKILTITPENQPSLKEIDNWFDKSIRELLHDRESKISKNLLNSWELIQKNESPSRTVLKKVINIAYAPISNLPTIWNEFENYNSEVKSKILDFKIAQNKLLEYIIDKALLKANENNYQSAFNIFEDAVKVITNHKDSFSRLKTALTKLEKEHQEKIDLLNRDYQTKQNNCDPEQLKVLDSIIRTGGKPNSENNIDKNCISLIRKLLIDRDLTKLNHQFNNWKELNPEVPSEFNSLMIAKNIIFADTNQIQSDIKILIDLPSNQQSIVLNIEPVRMQVVDYFKEKTKEIASSSGFPSTLEFIDKTIEKISSHSKTLTYLKELRKKVQKNQKRRIASLLFEYQNEVQKCSLAISAIQIQLEKTGSDRPPFQGVDDKCFKKLKNLVAIEKINEAENILKNWQQIRPNLESPYLERRNLISNKLAGIRIQRKSILALSEKLMQSIANKDDENVKIIINEAKNLHSKYTKSFKNENELELTNYFIAKGNEAVSNNNFNNAHDYCKRGLTIFPRSKKLKTDCLDLVNNKRKKLISGLAEKFKDYLEKNWLVVGISYPNGILGILDEIASYDRNNVLLTDLEVHTAFKNLLLDLIKKMQLEEARNLHTGWVKFFERDYITQEAANIREKAENLAATHILLLSRNLIRENLNDKAKKFLKFGIELQPITSVSEQIYKEIENLAKANEIISD